MVAGQYQQSNRARNALTCLPTISKRNQSIYFPTITFETKNPADAAGRLAFAGTGATAASQAIQGFRPAGRATGVNPDRLRRWPFLRDQSSC